MNRREVIRRSALSALGLSLTPSVLFSLESCSKKRPTQGEPQFLDQEQFDVIWVMAERVLPRTDSPGANDAGVAEFIDMLYGEYFEDDDREMHEQGLYDFMTACKEKNGKSFLDLSQKQQTEYLTALDEKGSDEAFFNSMRKIILWAFFTSEVGMKSMNYLPIPGRFNGCITIGDQEKNLVGNR